MGVREGLRGHYDAPFLDPPKQMQVSFATVIDQSSCYYRPQRSWGKVIFSQASVFLSTREGGMRGWLGGDTCECGGCVWWGDMHGWVGGHAWPGGGHALQGCVCGTGHVWQGEGMHGRGVHGRGVHGRGACMVGACVAGGMHDRGHAWQGVVCVAGACMTWNAFLFQQEVILMKSFQCKTVYSHWNVQNSTSNTRKTGVNVVALLNRF